MRSDDDVAQLTVVVAHHGGMVGGDGGIVGDGELHFDGRCFLPHQVTLCHSNHWHLHLPSQKVVWRVGLDRKQQWAHPAAGQLKIKELGFAGSWVKCDRGRAPETAPISIRITEGSCRCPRVALSTTCMCQPGDLTSSTMSLYRYKLNQTQEETQELERNETLKQFNEPELELSPCGDTHPIRAYTQRTLSALSFKIQPESANCTHRHTHMHILAVFLPSSAWRRHLTLAANPQTFWTGLLFTYLLVVCMSTN